MFIDFVVERFEEHMTTLKRKIYILLLLCSQAKTPGPDPQLSGNGMARTKGADEWNKTRPVFACSAKGLVLYSEVSGNPLKTLRLRVA